MNSAPGPVAARRWSRWAAGALLGTAVIATALSFSPGWFAASRLPNQRENLLFFFAENVGEPALCEGISWKAFQRYSATWAGGGASYQRSDCLERVAEARHSPAVCWQVSPLLDFDPLSSGHSALSCRRRTLAGERVATGISNALLVSSFTQLGYDPDRLHLEGVIPPAVSLRDVYLSLQHNQAALLQARQLVGHAAAEPMIATPMRAEDRTLLAQLVAVSNSDGDVCATIPPDQMISKIDAPFRDWCYFNVAYNTMTARWCAKITPRPLEGTVRAAIAKGVRPDVAEQMGLHADCDRNISRPNVSSRYGPQLPEGDEQLRRLLNMLNVAVPSTRSWSTDQLADYYRQFLFALWPGDKPDPLRDTARARLVRSLLDTDLSFPDRLR